MQAKILTLLLIVAVITGCQSQKHGLNVDVHNPSSVDRVNEMAEIDWEQVQQRIPGATGQSIVVTGEAGVEIPFQLVTNGKEQAELLIFPVSVSAGQTATYRVSKGEPDVFEPLVYGRLVPERKDDFTWENNRAAFRVYGPALKATGEISNGMDYWTKRTEALVIDKWYEKDLSGNGSYHRDHGEGLDFYKVGRTLGLGMTTPINGDTLCLGDNFVTAEILDNGPLRISFKLTYDPYFAGNHEITETRVISLDAFQLFNKVTNIFEAATPQLTVATGIVMPEDDPLENAPTTTFGVNNGIIAYETPEDKVNGTIYTAAIHPDGFDNIEVSNGHYLGINNYQPGTPYTYYAGGGWSKAGFNNFEEWIQYIKDQKEKIDQPLVIQIN